AQESDQGNPTQEEPQPHPDSFRQFFKQHPRGKSVHVQTVFPSGKKFQKRLVFIQIFTPETTKNNA
ncbi:hypothetical protein ACQWB4_23010, partial [Salmonella enterica subsp. enterica serovar Infantis]